MKTPKSLNVLFAVAILSLATSARAQMSMNSTGNYNAKQRISVNLKLTPSVMGFRAGVAVVDSIPDKFRLWVSNGNEKKFTISVSGEAGYLWSKEYKDAYFN